jgi:hypothetical protein
METLINRIKDMAEDTRSSALPDEALGTAASIKNHVHINMRIGKAKLKISGLETRPGILFDIFDYLGLKSKNTLAITGDLPHRSAIDEDKTEELLLTTDESTQKNDPSARRKPLNLNIKGCTHTATPRNPLNINIKGVTVNEQMEGFDTSLFFESDDPKEIDEIKEKLEKIPEELSLKPDRFDWTESATYDRKAHITLPIDNDGPGILYAFLKIIACPPNPAHRGNITMLKSNSFGDGLAIIEADVQLPRGASIDWIRNELWKEDKTWIPEIELTDIKNA